jgi:DNA-binding beta-propeller fold protein YncE
MTKARRSHAHLPALALLAPGLVALASAGCFLDTAGVDPAPRALNFPTSIVLAPPRVAGEAPAFAYVVNSNFDLRYNGGTVLALDLAGVDAAIDACRDEPCTIGDLADIVPEGGEVITGSFPGGAALSSDGSRLYAPFRSDGSLTYIDVNPASGALSCRAGGAVGGRCENAFRRGDESIASQRGESMPGDPSRLLLRPLPDPTAGDLLVVLDRSGKASLFVDRPGAAANEAPKLIDVVDGLPSNAVGLAYDEAAEVVWVSSANTSPTARLAKLGIALDARASAERSYLFRAGEVRLSGLDDGLDVRDLVLDGERLYVLSRRPQAVVSIDLARAGEGGGDLPIGRVIGLDVGASRLVAATVGTRRYLFATCYDGRTLFVIDAETGSVEDVVRGFSGPFEVVVDEVRARALVTDFRSSVVRVVDLSPLVERSSAPLRIVATLGVPRAPSELN